ncbi:MAG: tRNA 2-thiouridine(34) synthase MnmA [Spirochaeta sp. LUC14_002_19_P3]|nr:MAG: tRNA 2-thiouridine(34) synthase MnmA [Spirochaeta sp. LUC14_002_19_P3]
MKIGVLLSGGVDSSVGLGLLKSKYPDARITAYYLKIWLEDELAGLGSCPWEEDLAYARGVCELFGVPLKIISLQREYRERVVSYTVSELKAGRTPSPDIFCNSRIKFGVFFERVSESLDKTASGHYALVRRGEDGLFHIIRSPDRVKDQTYFLSHLTQAQAAQVLFPIGGFAKDEVRAMARSWNLPNQRRPDSQGICFLGKIRYPDFVRHYLGEKEGAIVEPESGRVLGSHRGAWFYTIGQRTGLGLSGGPWYVVGKDTPENVVFAAHAPDALRAAVSCFEAVNPGWIAAAPVLPARVSLKLRHGPRLISAQISALPEDEDGTVRLLVSMDESDRGVASGQFAVFYDGEECLGGAMIRSTGSPPGRRGAHPR